jgi:glycine cleavage system H protein
MSIPQNLKYSKTHEWVKAEGDTAVVGITHYAQHQLGDIVFVELAAPGKTLKAGDNFGTVESVKSVSDLVSPVSGEVTESNAAVVKAPETLNKDPYERGWMVKLKISSPGELDGLMGPEEYRKFTTEES